MSTNGERERGLRARLVIDRASPGTAWITASTSVGAMVDVRIVVARVRAARPIGGWRA